MRQIDLLPGDVILYSNGFTMLVLGRDADACLVRGREGLKQYIRYLNLRTGVPSPWLAMGEGEVRGEVIRGRESVWVPPPDVTAGDVAETALEVMSIDMRVE